MKVPLTWLRKYVPVPIPPNELAQRLTMAGLEVGEVEEIGADWQRDKVLVGHVVKVDKHPNADRLTLPTVDLGDGETISVVCGAPNVAAGQRIAFAREGAMLFSPRSGKVEPLKAAKIRGVISAGMVCSVLELGLGEDHEGILVLDDDAPIGTPLADHLGDAILDVEVTPNRPDCLSVLGIAHEVAALTGERVQEPDAAYQEKGASIDAQAKIEIADPDLCNRYTASLVTGVEIGPSPGWLQDALAKAGQRPINNVVDVTNYVMLEYGQPLHAFDFDGVKERTVIVRAARRGEKLRTLDGETRTLAPPMLAIADAHDAVGLAGVMGGAGTEVHEGTTSVLLESANFDPVNTRRTSAALRLSTEASHRFERDIRAELAPRALRRATRLILEIAGGEAAEGIVDLYPGKRERPAVRISRSRINQVLGMDMDMPGVLRVLESLGFEHAEETPVDEALLMKAPYWRSDITMEDDVVEEVARIVGYDAIPTTMLSSRIPYHEPQPLRELKESIKDILAAAGMRETVSYPLASLESLGKIESPENVPKPLRIANPISGAFEYLRTSLRQSLLETLTYNRSTSHGEGLRLFEIGRTYIARDESDQASLPEERETLVGVLSGPRSATSWLASQEEMDLFDAKGVLESVFDSLSVMVEFSAAADPLFHPGKTAQIVCAGAPVGVVGEVGTAAQERFDLELHRVVLFEVHLDALLDVRREARRYRPTARFPESYRDLALVVDADVPSARIQSMIERHRLVVRATPFDVYAGPGVPEGKRSVAYSVVFQSSTDTLTTEEVDRVQGDIVQRLNREVGAELRG